MDGMPDNCREQCINIHTFIHTYRQFTLAGLSASMFMDGVRKMENPEKTQPNSREHTIICTDCNQISGLNPRPWVCTFIVL